MASKRKQSEGIALLSMYNDEEDDEMEDAEEDEGRGRREEEEEENDGREAMVAEDSVTDGDRRAGADTTPVCDDILTPDKSKILTSMSQQTLGNILVSPPQQPPASAENPRKSGKLAIVDYGHDEVAMSPEPEEGEIEGVGRVMYGEELQTANGDFQDRLLSGTVQVLSPGNQVVSQNSEPFQCDDLSHPAEVGSEHAETGEAVIEKQKSSDPLDDFLPPPPKVKCSEGLQRKINKFLEYKKAGKSFNAEVRNRKDYRNPDFLLHAVTYQEIDQIGSCFSKDVFDPHGYDPSDYYDEIEADMRRESEKKEQEKKKAQKVEFVAGGTQPGLLAAAPRINMPISGSSAVTAGGLHLVPPSVEATNRDGRQNKKSKWDKVDGDQKNPLPSTGQDSVSKVGVHTAILSAANAGSGYMHFAQQKRREAEERRGAIDRKLERRS